MNTPVPAAAPVRPVKSKIGKNILVVLAVMALVLVAIALIVLTLAAKSGVVRIPLLSLLYHGPTPTRTVSSPPITAAEFQKRLEARLRTEIVSGRRPPYALSVTEQDLTGALHTTIGSAVRDSNWTLDSTQLAVRPTDLEILVTSQRGMFHLDFLIRLVPELRNGSVSFRPVFMQLGDIPVSPDLATRIAGMLFNRDLGNWTVSFGTAGVSDLQLRDGAVLVTLTPHP